MTPMPVRPEPKFKCYRIVFEHMYGFVWTGNMQRTLLTYVRRWYISKINRLGAVWRRIKRLGFYQFVYIAAWWNIIIFIRPERSSAALLHLSVQWANILNKSIEDIRYMIKLEWKIFNIESTFWFDILRIASGLQEIRLKLKFL